jgi:hypothetical protein
MIRYFFFMYSCVLKIGFSPYLIGSDWYLGFFYVK